MSPSPFRPARFVTLHQRIQLRLRLLKRHAGLKPGQSRPELKKLAGQLRSRIERQGNPHIEGSVISEVGWRHADNCEIGVIQRDAASDNALIAVEPPPPQLMADDGDALA